MFKSISLVLVVLASSFVFGCEADEFIRPAASFMDDDSGGSDVGGSAGDSGSLGSGGSRNIHAVPNDTALGATSTVMPSVYPAHRPIAGGSGGSGGSSGEGGLAGSGGMGMGGLGGSAQGGSSVGGTGGSNPVCQPLLTVVLLDYTSGSYAIGSTDVVFSKYELSAAPCLDEKVSLLDVYFVTQSPFYFCNDFGCDELAIQNVRVVDLDTGSVLMGPVEAEFVQLDSENDPWVLQVLLTDEFTVSAGTSVQIGVMADLVGTMNSPIVGEYVNGQLVGILNDSESVAFGGMDPDGQEFILVTAGDNTVEKPLRFAQDYGMTGIVVPDGSWVGFNTTVVSNDGDISISMGQMDVDYHGFPGDCRDFASVKVLVDGLEFAKWEMNEDCDSLVTIGFTPIPTLVPAHGQLVVVFLAQMAQPSDDPLRTEPPRTGDMPKIKVTDVRSESGLSATLTPNMNPNAIIHALRKTKPVLQRLEVSNTTLINGFQDLFSWLEYPYLGDYVTRSKVVHWTPGSVNFDNFRLYRGAVEVLADEVEITSYNYDAIIYFKNDELISGLGTVFTLAGESIGALPGTSVSLQIWGDQCLKTGHLFPFAGKYGVGTADDIRTGNNIWSDLTLVPHSSSLGEAGTPDWSCGDPTASTGFQILSL